MLYCDIRDTDDGQQIKTNINAVYDWFLELKMPFNLDKSKMMVFGSTATDPKYTLGERELAQVDVTKCLAVYLQKNLIFEKHISEKINKGAQILGCVKHSMLI